MTRRVTATPSRVRDASSAVRRVLAAGICLAATLLAVSPASANGRTNMDDGPTPAAAAAAALAMTQWLGAFDTPDRDADEARIQIPGAVGVRVALRSRGRVVSDVTAAADPLITIPAPGSDLVRRRAGLLRRAAGQAMAAALADRVVARNRETLGDALGDRLTFELELAGPLVPLAGRTLDAIVPQIRPGIDGLALRRGDRVALLFPGRMMAEGFASDLVRTLPTLASELDLPFVSYAELRERFDVRMYRFASVHFVQPAPGGMPDLRPRGQRIVAARDVTPATITETGRDLFNHLVTRLWASDDPVGLRGDYDAGTDRYRPAIAPAREQALVAYAAARWSRAAGLRPDDRRRGRDAAAAILEELRQVTGLERSPFEDPVASAAIVLAEAELAAAGAGVPMIAPPIVAADTDTDTPAPDSGAGADAETAPEAAANAEPVAVAESRGGLRGRAAVDVTVLVATLAAATVEDGVVTLLDPHDRAVILAAAARHALDPGPIVANEPDEMRAALDAAWAELPPGEQITLMPWLAWAEAWHAERIGEPMPGGVVQQLRLIRAVLEQVQISPNTPGAERDLTGGFALASGGTPLAGAQSARPALLLGWMLRDPATTGTDLPRAEVAVHRGSVRASARFLRQLSVRHEDRWAVRGSNRAFGGIRGAPWDLRMPLAAQAISLLAIAETLDGLAATER